MTLHKRELTYLRKMTQADFSTVMVGEKASYPHPWSSKNFQDCLKNPLYSCWAFEREEKLLGHVIMSAAVGEAHILNICVYPDNQGEGWGRKLLEESEWIAKQHQAETCFLEVRASNRVAIGLYESAGYHEIGLRKNYYPTDKGRENAIIMAKQLF